MIIICQSVLVAMKTGLISSLQFDFLFSQRKSRTSKFI